MSQAGPIYVRLGISPEERVQWLFRNERAEQVMSDGSLKQLAQVAEGGQQIVIIAPGAKMVTLRAKLPPASGARLQQALPYALEEAIAEDVEKLHFAIGRRDVDGALPVIAVERDEMLRWRQLFSHYGLHPRLLLNECLLLPWREREWTLLVEGETALLRTGKDDGFSFPASQIRKIIRLVLSGAEQTPPDTINVLTLQEEQSTLAEKLGEETGLAVEHRRIDNPLYLFAETVDKDAINLLQGEFSRKEQVGKFWRPWRLSAALLSVLLLLQLGMAAYRYHHLSALDTKLYDEVVQVYRDTFPEARNIVNAKVQMERKLAELRHGGRGGFSQLLATSGEVLTGNNGIQIQNIRFKGNTLDLELELPSLPVLDNIKQTLSQKGLQVSVRGVNAGPSSVTGRLSIQGSTE